LKNKLIESQGIVPERQALLKEAFDKLMQDVTDNLLPKNRDRFAQNLHSFWNDVRNFLS